MSETLETLIDNYISQSDRLFKENVVPDEKERFKEAVKAVMTEKIYDEIRQEVKDEALADAEEIIEKKAGLKRIKKFRKLTVDGLIVAFFVGLLVNQSTDIIGYLKGSFQTQNIWNTVWISLALLLICVGIFGWLFISELIKLLGKEKDETD